MDALESMRIEAALSAQAQREADEDESGRMDFLTMLVTQLENQDPLNPQDSAEFAAQLAQFSSVEQLVAMRQGIDQLVANASSEPQGASTTPAAASLDPASLVGREVTVFGGQIEVDAAGTGVSMDFRTIEDIADGWAVVTDAEGDELFRTSLVPRDESGQPTGFLRPGDHVLEIDPREQLLPEGVYGIRFEATGAGGEDVTVVPMVSGLVTGAVLAGDPAIRIGNRLFPLSEVLEVRLSGAASSGSGAPGASPGIATGGGQAVFRTQPGATPRPFGS